jgi:hypothetical protein
MPNVKADKLFFIVKSFGSLPLWLRESPHIAVL